MTKSGIRRGLRLWRTLGAAAAHPVPLSTATGPTALVEALEVETVDNRPTTLRRLIWRFTTFSTIPSLR